MIHIQGAQRLLNYGGNVRAMLLCEPVSAQNELLLSVVAVSGRYDALCPILPAFPAVFR